MTQEEFERSVFESFLQVAPFTITEGTIENKKPPEPDIVCNIDGRGEVGFELTELIDQSHMKRISLMFHTRTYLNEYWSTDLDEANSSIFLSKYSDSLIHFDFSQNTTLTQRKSVIPTAFELLLNLEGDTEGLHFENNQNLNPIIQSVNVNHISLERPIIDVGSYGWLGDPTTTAITKKCSKKYECSYPIELLAHIETNLLPPDDVWLPTVEEAAAQIGNSQFVNFWVYDRTNNIIKYSYNA